MKSGLSAEEKAQSSPLRVLFFEDCDEDIELCVRVLRSSGFAVEWDAVVTPDEVIDRARTVPYDVILSDYRMPQFTGMDLFEAMRSAEIQTPFILLTGSLGEENAVECVKQGVADYVLKDRLARLPIAVRRAKDEERLRMEQRRAAEALRSSEASYRSLIQSSPCGILRLSAVDGCILDANGALAGMLGYDSPTDLMKSSAADGILVPPQILSGLISHGGQSGRVIETDVTWDRKDGGRIIIRLAGRLLRDEAGAPTCLEMIADNVTERHSAQQRIEQLNRLYSVLTHANQTIVRKREPDDLFQELCRIIVQEGGFQLAWIGLLGPGTENVVPHGCCPPNDDYLAGIQVTSGLGAEDCDPIGRAIRENRHVVSNDLLADLSMSPWGERISWRCFRSMAAFPIVTQGRSVGAIGIYSAERNFFDIENVALLSELAADVSFALEAIEAERMHDRIASELDQFFALSLDMLCIADLNGYIQRLNPAWQKILGFSPAEMCSKPWVEFVHPDDRHHAAEVLGGFRSGAEVRRLELRFLSTNGTYRWLVGGATPALDRGVVFAALTDITERKQLEEQLRWQNLQLEERNHRIEAASRMKSEFLANMSHELRSPLNGIIGFSELLYDGRLGVIPERPRDFIGRIQASASHLLQLINGVLDLSKVEAGHLEFCPERVSVVQVVQEVTRNLSALTVEKRIQVEIEIEEGVDEVTIDAGRLRQVLYNYLSNALKFTNERGRVIVRVKSEGAARFRLEVSDTGIGIAEEDMGRLFIEFQQLDATTAKRYQGTGLGLALTKRIVEAQGGVVGVSSRPGEGSTFFAVLPRVPKATSSCNSVTKILVVEDQEVDRMLISQILKSNGYLVETAAEGDEAYEQCCKQPFDAITLDLVLQDAPGWEVLERIRCLEKHRNTPVVVVSGCDRSDVEIPIAIQGFLTKPVWPDQLVRALQRAVLPMKNTEVLQ